MPAPIANNQLPVVDSAALPTDVRKASKSDQEAYKAALGFEQALLSELLRSVESLQESAEGAGAGQKDQLPTTLAESVVAQGGIGLARTIYESQRSGR
jgi:hypothetical protein